MSRSRTGLASWRWRMASSNGNARADALPALKEWHPVSSFPSVIQMELVSMGAIPDPNIGENERMIQWVGEVDWEYECRFETPSAAEEFLDLVLEGLDTFATVSLNGVEILESDNMFVPHRVPVKSALRPARQQNELHILFESALKVGNRLEQKYGVRKAFLRDTRRNHMRKAQYHWGWDWGPILLTAGPYMPVYLDSYTVRIDNIHLASRLSEDHSSAVVTASVTVSPAGAGASAIVTITDPTGEEVGRAHIDLKGGSEGSSEISITRPQLWWPNGQGAHPLYTANVELLSAVGPEAVDRLTTRFGIRTIQVIQRPLDDHPGTTFMFRVNGRDIFIQGGNWIPADNMLPRISRQRYFDWVRLAEYCHLNMIRVWGGGIYETEDFFDACDEMGILVWHDYAFACNNLPTHDDFVESVAKEAEAQTMRLRNRASLALLCGGNEDFMFVDFDGIQYDHYDTVGPFDDKPFPQRKIYLEVLPKVAARLCPDVFYWANSPYGGAIANDATVGDIHQWSVWHGEQRPYQEYKSLSGRFVSEFGMHGFPVQRTVDLFTRGAASPRETHPQSRLVDCHNKSHGAHTRIARYLAENFRFDMTSLRNLAYSSQLMQAEAYTFALRDWKRLFGGPGRERCAGAVIWQLNDCYPVTSWAFVDFFLRPKPAFYAIRRQFAPVSVAAERTPSTLWVDEDKPPASKVPSFALFAHNTTPENVECVLSLRAYDFERGAWAELAEEKAPRRVTLKAGQSSELGTLGPQPSWTEDSLIILEVTLLDGGSGRQLARCVEWPEPYRYLYWPDDTSMSIRVEPVGEHLAPSATAENTDRVAWEDAVTVVSNQPLKGVWLEPVYDGTEKDDDPEPLWEDNMCDLLPDEKITVRVKGLKGRKLGARFLGDWEVGKLAPAVTLSKGNES
ncbi:Beta-mannosidase-like protein [Pleurostoma richardsiae]|uniref:Beta-mannosidase B n=1 Tax=Pleurostoma richardsiae TaxID=41990 RepID=A0AA38VJP6_9PEZI|nr:Beta-mannosidase-like protein [Pleurostoma richardsiae]